MYSEQGVLVRHCAPCGLLHLTRCVTSKVLCCGGMSRLQRCAMAGCFVVVLIYMLFSQVLYAFANGPAEPTRPEVRKVCSNSMERVATFGAQQEDPSLPLLYIVTPTYRRPEMVAELTRLGQTLLLVPRVHWLVAEDSYICSSVVTDTLRRIGLPFTQLASPMPEMYRKKAHLPRGVSNRRAAIAWIQKHSEPDAVLYFLDDDNSIDVRLLEQLRYTEKVSMFPVGLVGGYSVSAPVLDKEGRVVGFYDAWPAGRKFQVDMAGFAVNVAYLKKQPKVTMPYIAGHEEDGFLKSLNIELKDIEPLANSCSDVLVWHTRTHKNTQRNVKHTQPKHNTENIRLLLQNMKDMAILH